jgi:membrane-associated phospholipid phosphatase
MEIGKRFNCVTFLAYLILNAIMFNWQFISRFGETSLLLPAAMLIAAWLFHVGAMASARRWFLSFGVAAATVLVSKLAFMGWGIGSAALDFTGFSGHSMMAASVLPVLLYLLVPVSWQRLALCAGCVGMLLALLVGFSRLELDAHSNSEVLSGLILGFGVSLPFILSSARPARSAPAVATSLALVLMLAVPAAGVAAPTHRWLEVLATRLAGRDKPFQRGQWRSWALQNGHAQVLTRLTPATPQLY